VSEVRPLTAREQEAGRHFRDACQGALDAINAADPPGGNASPLWRVVRHPCEAHGGGSTGIELREHYLLIPRYAVCYCSRIGPVTDDFPHQDCGASSVMSEEGLLAWIWKDGRCDDCGLAVRSRRGRVVLAALRPPERVRIVNAG